MILTGHEIKRQVSLKRIIIHPFNKAQINPNSYNYRIGSEIIKITSNPIDPKNILKIRHFKIRKNGFTLKPGYLYLAHTLEKIGSDYYVTSLIGRSTIGRLGMWLQVTADLGHLGSHHNWTLEIKVVQPLRIYSKMLIGQVTFWKVVGNTSYKYSGKYATDIKSEPSRIKVEFS